MADEPLIMDYRDEQRILLSTTLDASPAAIWAALTEQPRIHRWWGEHVTLEAEPGGRFVERWTDRGGTSIMTTGTVTRIEPGELLELTWADQGWGVTTRVRFTLEPLDRGTRLVLEHQGWTDFPEDEREEVMTDHAAGWQRHLASLAHHLKGG